MYGVCVVENDERNNNNNKKTTKMTRKKNTQNKYIKENRLKSYLLSLYFSDVIFFKLFVLRDLSYVFYLSLENNIMLLKERICNFIPIIYEYYEFQFLGSMPYTIAWHYVAR